MASGQTLIAFTATDANPPTSSAATPDLRNSQPVLDFDAALNERTYFIGRLPRFYGGAGVTLSIVWTATTAISGVVQWAAAIERHDPATDLDADSFATAAGAPGTANSGGAGRPTYTDLVIPVASMDGLVAGEQFRLVLFRLSAGNTMAGDAELWSIEIRET